MRYVLTIVIAVASLSLSTCLFVESMKQDQNTLVPVLTLSTEKSPLPSRSVVTCEGSTEPLSEEEPCIFDFEDLKDTLPEVGKQKIFEVATNDSNRRSSEPLPPTNNQIAKTDDTESDSVFDDEEKLNSHRRLSAPLPKAKELGLSWEDIDNADI